jgi:hypothetical protein
MDIKFEVLTAVTVVSMIFWVVTLCSSEKVRHFGGTCHLHFRINEQETSRSWWRLASAGFLLGLLFDPEVGSDMFLRNVELPPNYIALQPRRQFPSNSVHIFNTHSSKVTFNIILPSTSDPSSDPFTCDLPIKQLCKFFTACLPSISPALLQVLSAAVQIWKIPRKFIKFSRIT